MRAFFVGRVSFSRLREKVADRPDEGGRDEPAATFPFPATSPYHDSSSLADQLSPCPGGEIGRRIGLKICFVKSFLLELPSQKVNSDNSLRASEL